MAKYLKIAASGCRCGAVAETAAPAETDAAVTACLERVFAATAPEKPDLIVLSEMCDLPERWGMDAYCAYLQARGETVWRFVREKARALNTWVAFSTLRPVGGGRYRNSCFLLDRAGQTAAVFDKRHPTLGELEIGVEPGDGPIAAECELGRVGCAICFDLNYTRDAAACAEQRLDLLLFPSLFHGGLLRQLWAYTARAHLIAASGGCGAGILSPLGQVLAESAAGQPEVIDTVNTDCVPVHLDFHAEKLRCAQEQYGPALSVSGPAGLGSVLVASESPCRTARQILEEFGIEPLDDYLRRVQWSTEEME